MALITCAECQGQISTRAPVCPHCGAPSQSVPHTGIAHRAPAGGEHRARPAWRLALAAVATWLFLIVVFMVVTSRCEEIFTDYGVALPALTRWLINTSRWVVGNATPDQRLPGVFVFFVPGLIALGVPFLLTWFDQTRRAGIALLWVLLFGAVTAFVIFLVGMLVPLAAVYAARSGGGV